MCWLTTKAHGKHLFIILTLVCYLILHLKLIYFKYNVLKMCNYKVITVYNRSFRTAQLNFIYIAPIKTTIVDQGAVQSIKYQQHLKCH